MTAGAIDTITVGKAIFAASLAMAIRDAQRVGDHAEAALCMAVAKDEGPAVLQIATAVADTSDLEGQA